MGNESFAELSGLGRQNPHAPGKALVGWNFSVLRHVPVCADYKELSRGLLWYSRLSSCLLAEEINWLVLPDRDMKPPCELGPENMGSEDLIYTLDASHPLTLCFLSHGFYYLYYYLYHFLLRCYCFLDSWTRLPEFEPLLCQVPSVQPKHIVWSILYSVVIWKVDRF